MGDACKTCGAVSSIMHGDLCHKCADERHPENRIGELEREVGRLRSALKLIASYDRQSPHGSGICPYGCDTPNIARAALAPTGNEEGGG